MDSLRYHLPSSLAAVLAAAALVHGPIAQLPNYHAFADQKIMLGIPHFEDVVSNLGFALVAVWGWLKLAPVRGHPSLTHGWAGYRLFLVGLLLTAVGSTYYHLAPDNARLVWDRLPIALACGGLLVGVWGDTRRRETQDQAAWLALAAVVSVAWWYFTDLAGSGDLRPYLLLQILPIVLVPVWQWIYGTSASERRTFAGALLLYVVAKAAEVGDHEIADTLGWVTGHTVKHLLASLAAALVVLCLARRTQKAY